MEEGTSLKNKQAKHSLGELLYTMKFHYNLIFIQ